MRIGAVYRMITLFAYALWEYYNISFETLYLFDIYRRR